MQPLYPELHLPLNPLGKLLHRVVSWHSREGKNLIDVLWGEEEDALQLIAAMQDTDFIILKNLLALQSTLIAEVLPSYDKMISVLGLYTGNKSKDF